MHIVLVCFAALWLICGIAAYPTLAKKERVEDVLGSLAIGMCGPIGLIAILAVRRRAHGWMWRPTP